MKKTAEVLDLVRQSPAMTRQDYYDKSEKSIYMAGAEYALEAYAAQQNEWVSEKEKEKEIWNAAINAAAQIEYTTEGSKKQNAILALKK